MLQDMIWVLLVAILPKNDIKAQGLIADNSVMQLFFLNGKIQRHGLCQWLFGAFIFTLCVIILLVPHFTVAETVQTKMGGGQAIVYATRMDAVSWEFSGSKFSCQLLHAIDGFGQAVFRRRAGESTRFVLQSQNPRMKTGKAALLSQPPMWFNNSSALTVAMVDVYQGVNPVKISRKISERMLAELHKGMDLQFVRESWYGDYQALKVIIPSLGFRMAHSEYLQCLGRLLPVNFSQVEKASLYYSNDDDDLTPKVQRYLDKVVNYIKEDPSVKSLYIDGHTDSSNVRSESLIHSQKRAEKVRDYLLDRGVPENAIVVRWHGKRYQVASNRTRKGKAKNRRVTLRLSKLPPRKAVAMNNGAMREQSMDTKAEKKPIESPAESTDQ